MFKVYENLVPSVFTDIDNRRKLGIELSHKEVLLFLGPNIWVIVLAKLNELQVLLNEKLRTGLYKILHGRICKQFL